MIRRSNSGRELRKRRIEWDVKRTAGFERSRLFFACDDVPEGLYLNRGSSLRVAAAVAKARMPVPRSIQEDGSGTALGVRVKLSIANGVMSTGSFGSKTST